MYRRRLEALSLLIVAPTLVSQCTSKDGGGLGTGNRAGSAGSVAGAGGSSSGSAGSPGGTATAGAAGTAEGGSSMGGVGGSAGADIGGDAGADDGGDSSGGSNSAGSAGEPMGGVGGAAGSTAGGQGGKASAGQAGASGGPAGQAGVGGNAGGASGKAGAGAGGLAGSGGAGGLAGSGGSGGAGGAGGGSGGSGGFSCTPGCGTGTMCCPSDALTTSCVPQTTAGCLAPDLTVSAERARETAQVVFRNFSGNHCALAEQCIDASGRRRLLRFETFTPNIGTADMRLGVPNTSNPVFEYSACHDHFHFKGYAEYDLLDQNGTVVATGHKQAFCLLDSERYLTSDNTVRRTAQFHCGNQGISRGWGDSYTPDLDCQWVDVTDVPPGNYQLRIRINQARTLLELRYDNNEALVPVVIP